MLKSIFLSLSRSERINLIFISLFTFAAIIVELFGLTLILPIAKLVLDSEFYPLVVDKYNFLGVFNKYEKKEFTFFIVGTFFIIFLLKTISLSILSYKKFHFINNFVKSKTISLFKIYLSQNISFFSQRAEKLLIDDIL